MNYIKFLLLINLIILAGCGPIASPQAESDEAADPIATALVATIPPLSTVTVPSTPTDMIESTQNSPLATPTVMNMADNGTDSGGRQATFPNTIIVYQREGRFPDSPQKWTIYHTGRIVAGDGTEWQIPESEVEPLFALVEDQNLRTLDDNYAPDGECLDCLIQTVTIYAEGEVKEIVITNKPAHTPQNLNTILAELDKLTSS